MTKINYALITLTLLLTSMSYAQKDIKFGISGGATFSSFRGNEIANESKSSLDFLIGIAADYSISEKLSIRTNLNYERKSVNAESFLDENVNIRSTHSYIILPVLLKYNFGTIADSFYMNGGSFVGFLINANSKSDDGGPDFENTDLNKNFDLGVSLGIGKRFDISNNYLDLEIRNNLGLVNISEVEVFNDGKLKTNSLNLIITYYLDL